MAFQKGQSGNPGGRPKENAEVTSLAREHSREAIERLVALMRQDEDKKLAKAACDSLLDRGLGKPAQSLEHSGSVAQLTHEQWLEQLG